MFTCNTIAVTHRKLCTRPFLEQIGRVLAQQPAGLILREKDLSWENYAALAKQVIPLCQQAGVPCYLNGFPQAGTELDHPYLQLSFPLLTEFGRPQGTKRLGVSVHSVEQAVRAQQLGADFLMAGHIFPTDCKPGLPPRGLEFLGQVCRAVTVPVYAIGGITPDNAPLAIKAGAEGVCIMSGAMKL